MRRAIGSECTCPPRKISERTPLSLKPTANLLTVRVHQVPRMPSCTLDPLPNMWASSESLSTTTEDSGSSSGFHSPGSPLSMSPTTTTTSPNATLKRRVRCASEPFVIQSDHRDSRSQSPSPPPPAPDDPPPSAWVRFIGWYPLFLLRVAKALLVAVLPSYSSWQQVLLSVPLFWISAWSWCVWQLLQLPLAVFSCLISLVQTRPLAHPKRTVLISGGGSVQALHLARNFYTAGARVIAIEVTGEFALTRFSTAVARFYSVPRPTPDHHQQYVRALCEIAHREHAICYVPVATSTPAYFDAVAKPHLELLGCACFTPGIQEVRAIDDVLELFRRCERAALPTPAYRTLTAIDDVSRLYDAGAIRADSCSAIWMAGIGGIRERVSQILPPFKHQLRIPPQAEGMSAHRPWVLVHDVPGVHYVTCTTIKESRVVANVTCRLERHRRQLQPIEHRAVDEWLTHFMDHLRHQHLRPMNGHVSFQLVQCAQTGLIKPMSARVGLSLPYICYTNVHPRLVWKPCRHFSRQHSGPLVADRGRYYMSDAIVDTLRRPSVDAVTRLVATVLDKREALFVLWDPLPYCVYYHMQLPIRHVLGMLRRAQATFPMPPTGVN